MRPRLVPLAFLLALLIPLRSITQQTPTAAIHRDPQALTVLTQALTAAGGPDALDAILDITGSGTITYYWAGEEVQGNVTVKGRGTGQFRLDAVLAQGTRTWTVNNGHGSVREAHGSSNPIALNYALNLGSFTFPIKHLVSAIQDNSKSVTYLGLSSSGDHQQHGIRIQQVLGRDTDPSGTLSSLTTRDFYVDSTTLQILSVRDEIHAKDGPTNGHPHEVFFSDYRSVNGVLIPFSITDTIEGNQTFVIKLDQVTFNSNFIDSDFEL